jgi:transcriptional regulator GlxA family with amidase domain
LEKPDVIHWISGQSAPERVVASVCTGAFLLAKTGKLTGKQVTTHWEDIDDLKEMFPSIDVLSTLRWVDEGSFVTSAGISAGIDMSLHLVERLHSRKLAQRTARQLEFDWTENN